MFLSLVWERIDMNIAIVNRQIDLLEDLIGEIGTKNEFVEVGCEEGHILEILSRLDLIGIGIDFLFLNTDLGTHYIVLAKKS